MAKPRPWTEASHGPLIRLADGLWHVEATLDSVPIGRRMTIARRGDGALVVHSVICCDAPTMQALDALGPVRWILVPSGYHRLDAAPFKARYPAAQVLAMPASRARVAEVVAVDGDHAALPADPTLVWAPIDGVPKEGVVIYRAPDGRVGLVFNDTFMNLPDRLPGFRGFVVKLMGSLGGPKVTRTARLALVQDKAALAAHLRRLAATPGLAWVVPGHGAVITDAPGAALRLAADRLHPASA